MQTVEVECIQNELTVASLGRSCSRSRTAFIESVVSLYLFISNSVSSL